MHQTGIEQALREFVFPESAIKTIAKFIEVFLQVATGNTMKCAVDERQKWTPKKRQSLK